MRDGEVRRRPAERPLDALHLLVVALDDNVGQALVVLRHELHLPTLGNGPEDDDDDDERCVLRHKLHLPTMGDGRVRTTTGDDDDDDDDTPSARAKFASSDLDFLRALRSERTCAACMQASRDLTLTSSERSALSR